MTVKKPSVPKAAPKVTISRTHLGELKPDPRNPRKHSARNIGVIADSLQEIGAARSIVIDEDGVVLAGNGVVEAAGEVGLENVVVIDAEGDEIIAVRRRNLTPKQKLDLAVRDNRASELAEWDGPVLAAIGEEIDLSGLFTLTELEKASSAPAADEEDAAADPAPDMGLRLDERYNYVVLLFRDASSWDRCVDQLNIAPAVFSHGTTKKVGTGRIVDGNKILDMLKKAGK